MSARWWLAVAALIVIAAPQKKNNDFVTWGKVSLFRLNAVLPTSAPLASLADFPVNTFTYALYPTASSGADGMVPGDIMQGTPRLFTVYGGLFDHHDDPKDPVEFQVIKSELAKLSKAPGGQGLLVYSALYTGGESGNCTGIVQMMNLDKGRLILTDQISYDCRGGGSAEYDGSSHKLTVRSARYNAGDKPCCPSQFDTIDFKLDGQSVKAVDVTIE